MIFEIDGRNIKNSSDFHDRIMECPGTPDFYGRNLDALYDVLTGFIPRPFKLVWRRAAISRQNLGEAFEGFISVLQGAAESTAHSERKFEYEVFD